MQCLECGESARELTLRYCENCGAKMPPPTAPGARRTGARPALSSAVRTTGTRRALSANEGATDGASGNRAPRAAPRAPPYDGPFWLAHVPAHSPSVLGVGLQLAALVLSILPFFAGVGPIGSLLVLGGGGLLVARELRAAGERHLVDWVPEALVGPAVPALYTGVSVVLAVRMLGLGVTPFLWMLGAVLVGVDQYRKVYVGEDGWNRLFEPRQLVRGLAPVALGGVVLCLLSLFFVWTPSASRHAPSRAVAAGPSELRVMDQTPASSDVVYNLLDMPTDTGWDQPLALVVALGLLGILAGLALRPEVPRPDWLRFAPVAVVLGGVAWLLLSAALAWGPGLFLLGLLATGFVGVYSAFTVEP